MLAIFFFSIFLLRKPFKIFPIMHLSQYYCHFEVYTFILAVYSRIIHIIIHIIFLILPVAAAALLIICLNSPYCINAFLFKSPLPKGPVYSDWSALAGLSRYSSLCFHVSSAIVYVNDCVAVTSQPARVPDGSFEGTVSEYRQWACLCR